MSRDAILAACWLHEPQPISSQPVWLGFPHRAGRYRPEGSAFSSPGCWSCRDMEGFLIRGWELILPAVALCTIPSESAISDRRVAGVSTPCGAVATRVTTVFVLAELYGDGIISNTGMGTYHPRGALSHVRSPASDRPVGLWFSHRAGRFPPGGSPCSFPGCRSCESI